MEKEISKLALSSFLLGIFTWIQFFFAPIAIILGILAIININIHHNKIKGYAYAIIGVILPLFFILLFVIRFSR